MKIAVFRTDRIGEVLLSTVAVDAIKMDHPDAEVFFITSEYARPIVEGRNDIAGILTVDTFNGRGWIKKAITLAKELRKAAIDKAVILNPSKLLHLACFLSGIPERTGFDRKWGFLLTKKIKDRRNEGTRHEIEYTMEVLGLIGIRGGNFKPSLHVGAVPKEKVSGVLERNGMRTGHKPLVVIHPGSSNPAKRWSVDNYQRVAEELRRRADCYVCIIGGVEEKELMTKILNKNDKYILNLAGVLDLKETAALISEAALFIGNDAGPMHMASALEVPLIAIFGRNIPGVSPKRWGPVGERSVVLHSPPGCSVCYDLECPRNYKCLGSITVEEVVGSAVELLGPWMTGDHVA